MWRPGSASFSPGCSRAMWAVLSGHTKKSAPARARRSALTDSVARIAAWSPASQAGMQRARAMQSSVTSGCSWGPSSLKPSWQKARKQSAAPSALCARMPRCFMAAAGLSEVQRVGSTRAAEVSRRRRPSRRIESSRGEIMEWHRLARQAAVSLARTPGHSAAVVAMLALGIAATVTVFSVLKSVLLTPLPNQEADRIVYLRQSARGAGADNAYFAVPEIQDLRGGSRTLADIGEFSTITFTLIGLGEPRQARAGVVDGRYFGVMGLRPVLGRLLGLDDDRQDAAPAAVLTHRFWSELGADPAVVGRQVRLGNSVATIVGVLEPFPPYPADTELIANVVSSPHHLSATMQTDRRHRMTEVFGRMARGVDLEQVRGELKLLHTTMLKTHPEAYDPDSGFELSVVPLLDQLTARARTTLLLLMAMAGVLLLVALSSVSNLLIGRAVRRDRELAVRRALGASNAALRRALVLESLLLCLAGALLGALLAAPGVKIVSGFAARLSVRAQDVSLDADAMAAAIAIAVASALVLGYVPRLPEGALPAGLLASRGTVPGGSTKRLQRALAGAQMALSFVLLTIAGVLLRSLLALQAIDGGFATRDVLAVDVPIVPFRTEEQTRVLYQEFQRRLARLPGVRSVAVGSMVPWRDFGLTLAAFEFTAEGQAIEPRPLRARLRSVSPGFFPTLGIALLAGRDFTEADRAGSERVVIVSETLAKRAFPGRDPIGRHISWTDARARFIDLSGEPRRIVGVVADIRDESPSLPALLTVYHPFEQELSGGRLFLNASANPDGLVADVRRLVRELAADQPVERAKTLEDIKAELLAGDRLNALFVSALSAVALALAALGVASVLALSVQSRFPEFAVRLAIGASPNRILRGVLLEAVAMAAAGMAVGLAGA